MSGTRVQRVPGAAGRAQPAVGGTGRAEPTTEGRVGRRRSAPGGDGRTGGTGPRVGLVLGAGGTVGVAYHCGVLAALGWDLGWDSRHADVIVGTSAGSVVGALLRIGVSVYDLAAWTVGAEPGDHRDLLAALAGLQQGLPPLRPGTLARVPELPPLAMWRSALGGPAALARAALAAMVRAGRVDFAALVAAIPALDGMQLPDGLRLCATRRDTGRRTVFGGGQPDIPAPPLGLAVAASCAIPGYVAPVRIGGHQYVDGGLHSTTNADVCAGEGFDVVIVVAPLSAAGGVVTSVDAPLRWMVHRRLDAECRALEAGRHRRGAGRALAAHPAGDGREPDGGRQGRRGVAGRFRRDGAAGGPRRPGRAARVPARRVGAGGQLSSGPMPGDCRRGRRAGLRRWAHAGRPAARAATAAAEGRSTTPSSVTSAVTSSTGVTSKAGFHTATPAGAMVDVPRRRTSSGWRHSMGMAAPFGQAGSSVEVGAATTKGTPWCRASTASS